MKKKSFVIVRTYSAGVFAGEMVSKKGKEISLQNAIRLWYWKGAASLSQMAQEGVKYPVDCKFGVPVSRIDVTEAIEIDYCTKEAEKNIKAVPSWKQ